MNTIKEIKKIKKNIDFTLFDEYKDKCIIQNDVIKDMRDNDSNKAQNKNEKYLIDFNAKNY